VKMRLAAQAPVSAPEGNAEILDGFLKIIGAAKSPGTKIVFQIPNRACLFAPYFTATLTCKYLITMNDRAVLEGIVQAEKDGFDGVMIFCFDDPCLWEGRQAVDIPVVGLGETSMLMAHVMGASFGVMVLDEEHIPLAKENARRDGFSDKLAGVRPIPISHEGHIEAMLDASQLIKACQEVGRELIRDGAEVLIPGCALTGAILRTAPGCAKYPNGLTEIDGVPVMDILATEVKVLETLVALKRAGSCWISRKGYYHRPSKESVELMGSLMEPIISQGLWRYPGP